jgi:serine protease Do
VKPEDIIVSMNGKRVEDGEDLVARVADTPIGQTLTVTVDRGGEQRDLRIVVRDRTEVFPDRFARNGRPAAPENGGTAEARFGMRVRNLSAAERKAADLEENRGVMVAGLTEDSFAGELGVQPNDIILSINRTPVGSVEDVRKVQSSLRPGAAVAFRLMRALPSGQPSDGQNYNIFFLAGALPNE